MYKTKQNNFHLKKCIRISVSFSIHCLMQWSRLYMATTFHHTKVKYPKVWRRFFLPYIDRHVHDVQ